MSEPEIRIASTTSVRTPADCEPLLQAAKRFEPEFDLDEARDFIAAWLPAGGQLRDASLWLYPYKQLPDRVDLRLWYDGPYDEVVLMPADYGCIIANSHTDMQLYLMRDYERPTFTVQVQWRAGLPPTEVQLLHDMGLVREQRHEPDPVEPRTEVYVACPV